MKRALTLLLACVLPGALSGCMLTESKPAPQPSPELPVEITSSWPEETNTEPEMTVAQRVLGEWICEVDLFPAVLAVFSDSPEMTAFLQSEDGLPIRLIWTFSADGTVKLAPEEASLRDARQRLTAILTEGLGAFLEEAAKQAGVSVQQILNAMRPDMTVEEYALEIGSLVDLSVLTEPYRKSGYYTVDANDRICIGTESDGTDASLYYTFSETDELQKVEPGQEDGDGFQPDPASLRRSGT